ncbi:conjugal transfer protein [Streptomyces avermitilis]|uniref:conjugal transfer protein n=1 Tax=Streptomyces avermitilis TaxID=33903 RepID=UPI0033A49ED7
MTDHNGPAGAVGGDQPSGQPGSFGPPQQPHQQVWQAQGQQAHGQQAQAQSPTAQQPSYPQPQPQHLSPDAARAQVAAAWVRHAPGQAAVPSLPPRETRPPSDSKKEKRERERAARKAAYEQKKAEKEQRKRGGAVTGSTTAPAHTAAPAAPAVAAAAAPHHAVTPVPAPAATAPTTVIPSTAPGPGPGPTVDAGTTTTGSAATTTHAGATPAGARATPASAKPARDFDVPRPGGRIPAGGRRTHVALRATLLITTCVFALGSCGVMGLVVGKSSGAGTAGLDAADAARYRLTEFPTQQAATFAEQYAMLCLSFSPETASKRRENLARYTSSGVDPECGWSGEGTQKAAAATWDGTSEELPEYGDHGRYLGVQVRTDDGELTTLTVPVYVKDLATGEGMRIAGDVGEMPMPARANAPELDQDKEVVDDSLSQQLQEKVFPGYFEAWAASDSTAMARFTAPGATLAATSGLAGRLAEPKINDVVALVPKSVQDTDPYAYKAGQSVQVRVVVDWGDPKDETLRRSYRMTVVNTAQGWFIKDIRGGVLDAQGGRSDSDEGTTPTEEDPGSGATDGATPTYSPTASPTTTPRSSKGKRPHKS